VVALYLGFSDATYVILVKGIRKSGFHKVVSELKLTNLKAT